MAIANLVSLYGINVEDFNFTFILNSGITAADVGLCVSMDSAARRVKLAADDDTILGVLQTFETHPDGTKMGAVATRGGFKVKTTGTVTIGQRLIGAGAGVAKGTTGGGPGNIVVALTPDGDANTAELLLG